MVKPINKVVKGHGRPRISASRVVSEPRTGFTENETEPIRRRIMPSISGAVTTVSTSERSSKVYTERSLKMVRKPIKKCTVQPMQAMWAKSLSGLRPVYPKCAPDKIEKITETYTGGELCLPPSVKCAFPFMDEQASAATLHHNLNTPNTLGTFGQLASQEKLVTNFAGNVVIDQAMVQIVALGQLRREIKAQEQRVLDARLRLEEITKHSGFK